MAGDFGLLLRDGGLVLAIDDSEGAPVVWEMTADEARHLANALGEGIKILHAERYGAMA